MNISYKVKDDDFRIEILKAKSYLICLMFSSQSRFSSIHLVLDEGFYSIVKILSNEFGNDLNCGNVWIDLILFCNEKSHFVLSLGMSPRLIPLITV